MPATHTEESTSLSLLLRSASPAAEQLAGRTEREASGALAGQCQGAPDYRSHHCRSALTQRALSANAGVLLHAHK